jgi:hypothetical protein
MNDNHIDQTEEEDILNYEVSDEALEAAGAGPGVTYSIASGFKGACCWGWIPD